MSIETWYMLEDGTCADPRDITGDAKGVLRHKDGRPVAYRPDGETPRSRSVDVEAERAKEAPKPKTVHREMKSEEPKRTYKNRETKAE